MPNNAETFGKAVDDTPWPPENGTLGQNTALGLAMRLKSTQDQLWADVYERNRVNIECGAMAQERVALAQERVALAQAPIVAANERMAASDERIAADRRATAEAQLEMSKMQQPHNEEVQKLYLEAIRTEKTRINETFETIAKQTRWAGYMFWITFGLGALLVVGSIAAFVFRPDANNQLVAAFFSGGVISMLAFFLRDPADRIQRAGGKLVQIQVAMQYYLYESNYWGSYFNNKFWAGKEITGTELQEALNSMRNGMQVTMRQLDESLASREKSLGRKAAVQKRAPRPKAG
jgi:hypothetical protein